MMIKIEFSMDTVAFTDGGIEPRDEAARILRGIASIVADGTDAGAVRDVNGNRVGLWRIRRDR